MYLPLEIKKKVLFSCEIRLCKTDSNQNKDLSISFSIAAMQKDTQPRLAIWMDEETRRSTVFIRFVQINHNLQLLCSDLLLP